MGTRDEDGEAWNFDDEDKRDAIREFVKTKKPLLIIGSHLQAVVEKATGKNGERRDQCNWEALRDGNKKHQEFLEQLYQEQHKGGQVQIGPSESPAAGQRKSSQFTTIFTFFQQPKTHPSPTAVRLSAHSKATTTLGPSIGSRRIQKSKF